MKKKKSKIRRLEDEAGEYLMKLAVHDVLHKLMDTIDTFIECDREKDGRYYHPMRYILLAMSYAEENEDMIPVLDCFEKEKISQIICSYANDLMDEKHAKVLPLKSDKKRKGKR